MAVIVSVCQVKSDHHHRHYHLTLLTDVTSSWSSHHIGQCTMQLHRVHGYDMVSCITESYVTSSRTISSSGMHHHIVHMVQCSTVSHISQCMYRVHYVMAQYSTIQCSTSMQYSMYSSATVVRHSTTHRNILLCSIMYSVVAVVHHITA